jgi:hypothetical protein
MHWTAPRADSSDPHLASKSHPQATCGWHSTWPEAASSLGLNSMGSIKATAAPHHQLDAFHSAGLDQDQVYHAAAAAGAAVHSPLASSPAHSNAAAGSAAAKRHSNGIDGVLLNQLLLQTPADSRSNLHSKASAPSQHQQQQLLQQLRMPHNSHGHMYDGSALTPPAPGDWRLGTDVQCEPVAAPELQELLSQFPASQHKVLLDSLMASTNPQELLLTLQAAAATDTLGSPLHNHHQVFDHGSAHWMQQAVAAAGTSPSQHSGITDLLLHPNTPTAPNSGNQLLQQLQLQASLAAQQAAMSSSVPAAAASSLSAAQQQLLLQQLQSVAAAANNPGALAQLLQQQMYSHGHSNNAAAASNLWNNLAAVGLGTSPAAAAAALAAQQQQQQQTAMSAFMAQAALAQQRQQQHSSMVAAGHYYQQLAAQLMANQLAAASSPSSYASLATSSFGSLAGSSAPSRAGSAGFGSIRDGMSGGVGLGSSFQRAPSGFSKGRRNSRALSNSGSSRATSAGLSGSVDVFGYLGSSSGGSSRASSYAGSDMEAAADSAAAALAAGLTLQDLCPASFQETWGAAAAAAATASNSSSSASSDAASSSWGSSSGAASPASSPGSSTSSKSAASAVTAANCSAACPPGTTSQQQQQPSKGAATNPANVCPAASNDAVKASSKKDQRAVAAAAAVGDASCKQQQQLSKLGGCPVWFPGAREASGDDSWYLDCPPTCRLFVGNIGSWVDEDALLGYFGKYGNVVDVQVGCAYVGHCAVMCFTRRCKFVAGGVPALRSLVLHCRCQLGMCKCRSITQLP